VYSGEQQGGKVAAHMQEGFFKLIFLLKIFLLKFFYFI
jgi:hypothetical protein